MNEKYNKNITSEEIKDIFGRNLRKALAEQGITYEAFAELMNVSTRVVYDWTGGIKSPRLDKICIMCNILNITLDSLIRY